jgi:signal transduction histidine kinase
VITGQGDERVAVEMMRGGALDYVVKDADFLSYVPEVVRRALDQLAKDKRLIEMEAALRESEAQVLEISEREQRRIGQDLHDGLGQQLTAIELMCQALKSDSQLASKPRALQAQLDRVCRHIREAITQTRSLAHGLTSFKVESGGLEIALTDLAQSTNAPGRMRCRFRCAAPVTVHQPRAATHLYRIAQEAVNNALRHSQAREITIDLVQQNGSLLLQVADNGKGFPEASAQVRGLGLGVMKHRASVIGARLEVKSKPGKGVIVTCALPNNK